LWHDEAFDFKLEAPCLDALLEHIAEYPEWLKVLVLIVSTFVSEDLTTITAGILISEGTLSPLTAFIGCFLGILIGDGLLYLLGLTLGRRALKLPILRKILPESKVNKGEIWFRDHGLMVVLISRFVPGTRLPIYFAAGLLGSKAKFFLLAAALAVLIWTPLLLFGGWYFGENFLTWIEVNTDSPLLMSIFGVVLLYVLVRVGLKLTDWRTRRRAKSRLYRWVRWEFWSILPLYAPIFVYNLWMMLRYRRLTLPLISNPGIEYSGFVGESKNKIYQSMANETTLPFLPHFIAIPAMRHVSDRVGLVRSWMVTEGLDFPIILKPDVGQRGAGVKRIHNEAEMSEYFRHETHDIQAQSLAAGPYEFGAYYVRLPGEDQGRVLGLTGKAFPRIVGDGKTTILDLILENKFGLGRYHIFIKRFHDRLDEVLKKGEVVDLVTTGNHCLGTVFQDHSHLLTEALQERFDTLSKSIDGFFIGRYDLRANDLEEFRQGRAFKILELNGAGAEPSHMYDSRYHWWAGMRMLMKHWQFLWQLGALNEKAGHKPPGVLELMRSLWKYLKRSETYVSESQ
jgi:membrane protein DedA with SNARE-associated domain